MFNLINKVKNRKGFTLVELLVVLAVLAIISAIAIPRFAGVQDSAKEKADKETINTIQRALELCVASELGINLPDATTGKVNILTITGTTVSVPSTTPTITIAKIEEYLDTKTIKLNKGSVTFELNSDGSITHTP
jgi:type IV pilus assembly protein PilA